MSRCGHRCRALLLAVAALVLYGTTIVATIGWTDTGELMAVAHTLGTAHPTGYPLMSVVARFWLLVPTGLRVAMQLNWLSAVFVAGATGIFSLVFIRLFAEGRKEVDRTLALPAVIGVAALASSLTYWIQSSSYEVYALHLLLCSIILATYHEAVVDQRHRPGQISRWWFAFAYAVGLGFANHMTTVLLGPALLWDYVRREGWNRRALRRIGLMTVPALVALTMYLVLPVRSSSWPPLNWGDPSAWESFWRHVSGAQYRVWMFSGGDVIARQWAYFRESLATEFAWPLLLLALYGWVVSWRRWRRGAELLTVLAVTGILYGINYDIHEIGPYFFCVYVAIAALIVPAMADLAERSRRVAAIGPIVVVLVACAGVAWQIIGHHPRIARANPPAIEQFARTTIEGVERGAVIFTARWDYLYSPLLYLQHVEKLRTDVLVIDHALLRDRTWYVEGLRRRAPWLDSTLASEFEGFLHELRKFERGAPFVPAVIQMRWDALLSGILRTAGKARPVYVDVRLAAELRPGPVHPEGHLLRVSSVPMQGGAAPPEWILIDGIESAYLSDFKDYLAASFVQHALAAAAAGDGSRADSLARIAAGYSPRHPWLSAIPPTGKKLGQ